jgi:CARDB
VVASSASGAAPLAVRPPADARNYLRAQLLHLRMRPLVASLAVVIVLFAAAFPATSSARSAAGVRLLECRHGATAADRQARFRAVARRVAGAQTMWIRFRLQERTARGKWRFVGAPGLGAWRRSRPGVGRFAIRQRVLELAAGSAYRVVAGYRWYSADGELVLRARRRSRACRQPGSLPNLKVRRVVARPLAGSPGIVLYRLDVVNRGPAHAAASNVRLSLDGDVVDTAAVPPLGPGETRGVPVTGPPCRAWLVASVDPTDVVREANERDNSLSLPCPPLS